MTDEATYKEMSDAIVELDEDKAKELAQKAINDENIDLLKAIELGFGDGIRRVGDLWDEGEFFLPELMRGAQIMQEAIAIITPHLKAGGERKVVGKVVIATIEGDIHSIGKTIVGTMLSANGFDVIDLGADISAEKIVEAAIENKADIVGVSALLTTTMTGQKKVVELIKEKAPNIKVILGGAPVTQQWTDECKADAYAENAVEAIKVAKSLMG